jgi:hypothetical protein
MYSLKKLWKYISMFLMIFQSSMGPRKSRCDVHNGTTQGNSYPFDYWKDNYLHKFVLKNKVCDRRQKCIKWL